MATIPIDWLNAGKLIPVNRDTLREIISQHIATKKLTNRGTADAPNWMNKHVPFVPNKKILRALLASDKREGSLLARATKG